MKTKSGLTLVEFLIVIVLTSLVLGAIYYSFEISLRSWKKYQDCTEALQNARIAVDRMVKEMRQGDSLSISGGDEVTFSLDTDGDQVFETSVRYYLSSTGLYRSEDEGTGENLANYINSLQFSSSGTLVTVTAQVVKAAESIYLRSATRYRN